MPTTPIANLADVYTFMGLTGTAKTDAIITPLMTSCSQAIGNFCNRTFESTQYTEYRNGNGKCGMMLSNSPITAFTSLTVNGNAIPVSAIRVIPKGRRVILDGYTFGKGDRNVVLTYQAGYGDTDNVAPWPADLQLAFFQFITVRYRERDRLGVEQERFAGQISRFADAQSGNAGSSSGIPPSARIILENYKNVIPETGC